MCIRDSTHTHTQKIQNKDNINLYRLQLLYTKHAAIYLQAGTVVVSLVLTGFGAIGLYCLSEVGVCNIVEIPAIQQYLSSAHSHNYYEQNERPGNLPKTILHEGHSES